jgi:hypothetical protein
MKGPGGMAVPARATETVLPKRLLNHLIIVARRNNSAVLLSMEKQKTHNSGKSYL